MRYFSGLWRVGQAALVYCLTQFIKMMLLATFFMEGEAEEISSNIIHPTSAAVWFLYHIALMAAESPHQLFRKS